MAIDHKQLLIKYIDHVETCEGLDFIGEPGETSVRSSYRRDSSKIDFSEEEWAELRRLGGYGKNAVLPPGATAK